MLIIWDFITNTFHFIIKMNKKSFILYLSLILETILKLEVIWSLLILSNSINQIHGFFLKAISQQSAIEYPMQCNQWL